MAKINRVCVGESLVGRATRSPTSTCSSAARSAVESAFCNALTNNKDGSPRCCGGGAEPDNQAEYRSVQQGDDQRCQTGGADVRSGPARGGDGGCRQRRRRRDSMAEADDLFICVGVFIHWQAEDDKKIQDYNYKATKESIARAINGEPKAKDVVAKKGSWTTPSRPTSNPAASKPGPLRLHERAFSFPLRCEDQNLTTKTRRPRSDTKRTRKRYKLLYELSKATFRVG